MQRVVVTEQGLNFQKKLFQEQKQEKEEKEKEEKEPEVFSRPESAIKRPENKEDFLDLIDHTYRTEIQQESSLRSPADIEQHLRQQIGQKNLSSYIEKKIEKESKRILQDKGVYQKQFQERTVFLDDNTNQDDYKDFVNQNLSMNRLEYSNATHLTDEREKHKRLVYVESQITKMLSKYRKHQARQEKLFQEVQQQKELLHEQKMARISQVPSFSQDSHVSTRNRSYAGREEEESEHSFDLNQHTQSHFRRQFLLQEKHNRKYTSKWKDTYFPSGYAHIEHIRAQNLQKIADTQELSQKRQLERFQAGNIYNVSQKF